VTEAEVKLGSDPSLLKTVAQSGNVTTVVEEGAQ